MYAKDDDEKYQVNSNHHEDESLREGGHSAPVEEAKSWTCGERHQGLHDEQRITLGETKMQWRRNFFKATVSLTLNPAFEISHDRNQKQMLKINRL